MNLLQSTASGVPYGPNYQNHPASPLKSNQRDFYQEKQQGGLCGLHASNAYLGGPVATVGDLRMFLRETMTDFVQVECESQLLDPRLGNDPMIIRDYLESTTGIPFVIDYNQTPTQAKTTIESLSDTVDRFLLGYSQNGYQHFVALRKDDKVQWKLVDSLRSDQPDLNLDSFLKGKQGIHLIYSEDPDLAFLS